MAETGNENGAPNEGRGRGLGGPPPTDGHGDPEWVTEDFSSIDLGEDSVDTSARPVRRLDLPPLAQAGDDAGVANARPTDVGVFASVPDDENLTVSSSAPAGDRTVAQPIRTDGPSSGAYQASASPPKQGAPPHPLAAGRGTGAATGAARGAPDRFRAGMGADSPAGGEFGDYTTVYEDDVDGFDSRFGGQDRRQSAPASGARPGPAGGQGPREPGRSSLETAPAMTVQQDRSRWIVPVAALLGVLALVAGYWVFVRDGDDSATFAADDPDDLAADLVEEDIEGDETGDATPESTDPAAPAALSDSPVLTLNGAAEGPLEVETQYEMAIDGVPNGSQYLVVVDDIPQEPALDYLPVLILPEGRHTISVTVTSGDTTANTNPVDVYVLAPDLTATYRANLSSVSVSDQGWSEALQQFDNFREAGHENVMLSPSDPYPSLLPGFWNIYVGGFADAAAATAYCEQFDLAIPDACFPAPFDPDGPPRDG